MRNLLIALAGAIAAAAIVVGVIWSMTSPSEAERYLKTNCFDAGLQVVVGERETVYTCLTKHYVKAWREDKVEAKCVALLDGELYTLRPEMPCDAPSSYDAE